MLRNLIMDSSLRFAFARFSPPKAFPLYLMVVRSDSGILSLHARSLDNHLRIAFCRLLLSGESGEDNGNYQSQKAILSCVDFITVEGFARRRAARFVWWIGAFIKLKLKTFHRGQGIKMGRRRRRGCVFVLSLLCPCAHWIGVVISSVQQRR